VSALRRIYLYVLAFAGLWMLAAGCANLLQLGLELTLRLPVTGDPAYVRTTAALWAAAALVGLPVWLLHWRWIQRGARADPAERASTLRRLFVYLVLAISLLTIATSLRDALEALLRHGPDLTRSLVEALPLVLVGLLVWCAHLRVSFNDRRLVGEQGGSATLRRWYVYGAAFVGLMVLLDGARQTLETLWRLLTTPSLRVVDTADPAATTLVGLGVWLTHWRWLATRTASDDEQSALRTVYLFLGLSVGVVGALVGASQLLYYALARLLGIEQPGGVGGNMLQAAAGPASAAIVYGVGWAYQRAALRRQAQLAVEAPRQAKIRRFYTYLVALIALALWSVGVAGLLWSLADAIVGAPGVVTAGEGWRGMLALHTTLIAVGLPVWLTHWRAQAPDEARALPRRLYGYVVVTLAMLAVLGSAAAAVYRVLELVLGASDMTSTIADLAHALAVFVVGAAVAGYHFRVVRRDATAAQARVSAPDTDAHTLLVRITTTDAAQLGAALQALRSSGATVDVVGDDAGGAQGL
jgi:hypothetical protein